MFIVELLTIIGDILFPPHKDERIVRALTDETLTELYQPHATDTWTALSPFKDTRMRALIHQAKYERDRRAQKLLGTLLMRFGDAYPDKYRAVWIPIPLSPARLRARGYNQVEAILKETTLPFLTNVLVRTRDTQPQTTLKKNERLANMIDAFQVISPHIVTGKNIILIDDVVTTGATLSAARDVLVQHNPESITLLALAH